MQFECFGCKEKFKTRAEVLEHQIKCSLYFRKIGPILYHIKRANVTKGCL